jgi:ABC-type branched-subunit amino acid transport system substrate-binding protein
VTVYVSLPLSGEGAAAGRAAADGARLALRRAGGMAGATRVRAVFLDDAGRADPWPFAAATANARRATRDSSAIAFIGGLGSGPTRAALPVTNQAGMLQVSPGASAADLTRRVSARRTPERYRPEEERTFVRLVPAGPRDGGGARFRPPEQLPAVDGFRFEPAFARRFGRPPSVPAAYGFEAMDLILDAVAVAGDSREEVREEVLGTAARRSILGTYSFDESGDIRFTRR